MHSDNRLIRKIRTKNDKKSANELVQRYYDEIYAYTYKQLQDKENALDITQEIFIAVLKGINNFDEKKASFRTWIYRVASNKITDFYRSNYYKYQKLAESDYEINDLEDFKNQEEIIIDNIVNYNKVTQVMNIVSGYDLAWLMIFQMKIFEELSFKEISERLAIYENTAKTRYYAMIKKIKEEFDSYGE